jgi:hypothetical protein
MNAFVLEPPFLFYNSKTAKWAAYDTEETRQLTSNEPTVENDLALALRIGITGARNLSPAHLPRIRAQATEFLVKTRGELERLALSPDAKRAYDCSSGNSARVRLHVLSPLAEGADRLLAVAALENGYLLSCPLPFTQTEYENDFTSDESRQEFRSLLDRAGASILELDGARGEAQNSSYEAVGRFVVRNCDILVAIWDGQPGKGFGGTTDIVRFATSHGPPVLWIHAEKDTDPIFMIDGQDFRTSPKDETKWGDALRSYLSHLILPPTASEPHASTWFERAAKILRRPTLPPFLAYRKPMAKTDRWIWRAHSWLIKATAGAIQMPAWKTPQAPADKVAAYWFGHYHPSDALAGACARRYRSSYVWVFGLAAIAVIFASIALVVPPTVPIKLTVTGIEFLALILIGIMVFANERQRWHQRFLEYRLLAELCRKQQALSLFGWSLQGPSVTDKSVAFRPNAASAAPNWVGWLFGALQRAAPISEGIFDLGRTGRSRDEALRDLIDDQLSYHQTRAIQSQRASDRLGQVGEWLFVAVLAFVAIKLVLVTLHGDHHLILVLGLAAAILPALSAGFVGIRSYAELPLLADQSRRMQAEMEAARIRVQQIDIAGPLASQLLGSVIFGVATVMLQDIQGWVQLFRAKVVEPG